MENTSKELVIDEERLRAEMAVMEKAINEFVQASTDAFTNELANFEAMNSDFVNKYIRIIESIRDHQISNLDENINILYQNSITILENLKAEDASFSDTKVEK